jgi:hypothetical protein
LLKLGKKDMDTRDKRGHDERMGLEAPAASAGAFPYVPCEAAQALSRSGACVT